MARSRAGKHAQSRCGLWHDDCSWVDPVEQREKVWPSSSSILPAALARVPVFLVGAIIAAVAIGESNAGRMQRNVPDDAVTSMQYAKNLALGHGLVFNVGERVDGYTNFLWVLFMTPLYALSRALHVAFVPLMTHVGILCAVACLVLVYLIGARSWGRPLAAVVAVLLCLVDSAFTTWAVLGLEVHFLSFFLLLALWLERSQVRRRGYYVGLALLAAHLTRPDAAAFGACFVASRTFTAALAWRARGRLVLRAELRELWQILGAWLVPYSVYFAWHYHYYGAPFPNTYYLKLGGGIDGWARGREYVRDFFEIRAWTPLLGLLAALAASDRTVRTLLLFTACHTLYVTYVGGDFMPGHRFLVPEIPLFALLVGRAVAVVWELPRRLRLQRWLPRVAVTRDNLAGFGAAVVVFGLALLARREQALGPLQTAIDDWRDAHNAQRRLLTWLSEVKPREATFATGLIGHTGFYGNVRVIDTYGVIDPVVAKRRVRTLGHGVPGHEKSASVAETLAKKPTYVGIFVLGTDLWKRGYYLDTDVPANTVPGVWVRDELVERGHRVPGSELDFEHGQPDGWVASGRAFEHWPSTGHESGQGEVVGAEGGFINSFHASLGNTATGTLRSPPLLLTGDRFVFRVAGGNDPVHLRVALVIDGHPVLETTGRQSDLMGRRAFDIAPYRGQHATLELTDDSSQPWGYIAVDEIAQWTLN